MFEYPNWNDPRRPPPAPRVAGDTRPGREHRRPGQLTLLGWLGLIFGLLGIAGSIINFGYMIPWLSRPRHDYGFTPGSGLYRWQTCILLLFAAIAPCIGFMLLTASYRLLNDLPGGVRLMGKYLKYTVVLAALSLIPTIAMSDGINHYNSVDITPTSPGIGCVIAGQTILFAFWAFFVLESISKEESVHWDAWINAGKPEGGPSDWSEQAHFEAQQLERPSAPVQDVVPVDPPKPAIARPDGLIYLLIVAYSLGGLAVIGGVLSIDSMFGWLWIPRTQSTALMTLPRLGLFQWQTMTLILLRALLVLSGSGVVIAASNIIAGARRAFAWLYVSAVCGTVATLASASATITWADDIAYMTMPSKTADAVTTVKFTQECIVALALGATIMIIVISRLASIRSYRNASQAAIATPPSAAK